MGNAIKIACIVAGGLIVTGLTCGFIGLAAMNFDFTKLSTEKFVTQNHTVSESFNSIKMEKMYGNVRFVLTENNECEVECVENAKRPHAVTVEDNTLVIRAEDNRKWYDYIGIHFKTPTTTVYLPQTAYEELTLQGSVSNVSLDEEFVFQSVDVQVSTGNVAIRASVEKSLSVRTSTGKIAVYGVTAQTMQAQVSTGDITIQNCEAQSLTVKTTTGDMDLNSVKAGDIQAQASTGDIDINESKAQSLTVKTTTGDIDLNSVIAEGDMRITADTGDVELSACDAGALYIRTDTGDVVGTLLSDKVFFAQSDTGKIRVPNTIEGGRCEIRTDTGDITMRVIPQNP